MVAITQEHLTYVAGLIGVIAFIRSISTSIDNKIEKNNDYLEDMIDRKLDKKEYENKKVLVGYNGIDGKEVTMSKFKEDINEIRDSRSTFKN